MTRSILSADRSPLNRRTARGRARRPRRAGRISPARGPAGRRRAARGRGPARCRTPPCPASIRDSSRSRSSASRTVRPGGGDRAVAGLLDHDVPVGVRRDLGQVGDHQHLGVRASWASRRPTSTAARAADPGVDLVEDERRHRAGAGQRHLERQHHPGQLAAGGALVQRAGARSRCWRRAAARPRRRRRR